MKIRIVIIRAIMIILKYRHGYNEKTIGMIGEIIMMIILSLSLNVLFKASPFPFPPSCKERGGKASKKREGNIPNKPLREMRNEVKSQLQNEARP